jgi:hypothetical protein
MTAINRASIKQQQSKLLKTLVRQGAVKAQVSRALAYCYSSVVTHFNITTLPLLKAGVLLAISINTSWDNKLISDLLITTTATSF